MSAASRLFLWCRDFRQSPCARCAVSNSEILRSVPTTSKFPLRYWMSASDASSRAEAIFLPFASMTSAVCTIALPAHMAEREPTDAKPVSPCAVSPWRCCIFAASMPSFPARQTRKNGGVSLAGRLHVAAENDLFAAGKGDGSLFHRHRAGVLQHAGDPDAAQFFALRRIRVAVC